MNASKIRAWFKKYFHWIVVPLLLLAGFFTGRKSVSGTRADIERLRHGLDELTNQLQQARRTIDELRNINRLKVAEYNKLRGLLEADRLEIERARQQIDTGRADLATLESASKRLRELVEQHRAELEVL